MSARRCGVEQARVAQVTLGPPIRLPWEALPPGDLPCDLSVPPPLRHRGGHRGRVLPQTRGNAWHGGHGTRLCLLQPGRPCVASAFPEHRLTGGPEVRHDREVRADLAPLPDAWIWRWGESLRVVASPRASRLDCGRLDHPLRRPHLQTRFGGECVPLLPHPCDVPPDQAGRSLVALGDECRPSLRRGCQPLSPALVPGGHVRVEWAAPTRPRTLREGVGPHAPAGSRDR
jgi:hypothetical protein